MFTFLVGVVVEGLEHNCRAETQHVQTPAEELQSTQNTFIVTSCTNNDSWFQNTASTQKQPSKRNEEKCFEVFLEICTLANQIYAWTLQRDLLCHGLSFLPNCWIPTCRPLNLEKNVFDPDRWANRGRGRNDFAVRAVDIAWVSSWKTQRRDECSPLVASNPKSSWSQT